MSEKPSYCKCESCLSMVNSIKNSSYDDLYSSLVKIKNSSYDDLYNYNKPSYINYEYSKLITPKKYFNLKTPPLKFTSLKTSEENDVELDPSIFLPQNDEESDEDVDNLLGQLKAISQSTKNGEPIEEKVSKDNESEDNNSDLRQLIKNKDLNKIKEIESKFSEEDIKFGFFKSAKTGQFEMAKHFYLKLDITKEELVTETINLIKSRKYENANFLLELAEEKHKLNLMCEGQDYDTILKEKKEEMKKKRLEELKKEREKINEQYDNEINNLSTESINSKFKEKLKKLYLSEEESFAKKIDQKEKNYQNDLSKMIFRKFVDSGDIAKLNEMKDKILENKWFLNGLTVAAENNDLEVALFFNENFDIPENHIFKALIISINRGNPEVSKYLMDLYMVSYENDPKNRENYKSSIIKKRQAKLNMNNNKISKKEKELELFKKKCKSNLNKYKENIKKTEDVKKNYEIKKTKEKEKKIIEARDRENIINNYKNMIEIGDLSGINAFESQISQMSYVIDYSKNVSIADQLYNYGRQRSGELGYEDLLMYFNQKGKPGKKYNNSTITKNIQEDNFETAKMFLHQKMLNIGSNQQSFSSSKYPAKPPGFKHREASRCPISSEPFKKSDKVLACSGCKNIFNATALNSWFVNQKGKYSIYSSYSSYTNLGKKCPYCKKSGQFYCFDLD